MSDPKARVRAATERLTELGRSGPPGGAGMTRLEAGILGLVLGWATMLAAVVALGVLS